ncbi:YkvI family membrane protein [Salimicrobium halophilum]|uniref:Uncharacterized membrane protein YkvI n=1 Tax=Salimicrobium halophilum TaxID=86666 RepID=A0A1G8UQZ7_9BACI|nr:hypothetical protein [Salimicrobium halophilum]SDJ56213.1 Uncharacterized membrane protein YkvI [Salimicrobium halophilum]
MWKSGFRWIALIVGTMIGAGYASGRELWQFFGPDSSLAILLFALMFTVSCYSLMHMSYAQKSKHYVPVLEKVVGRTFVRIYDVMIIIYLFTTTVIMLAGSGASFEAFHQSYRLGVVVMVICLVFSFFWNVQGIVKVTSILFPLLLSGLALLLFTFLYDQRIDLLDGVTDMDNWMAAFPFTALNVLPLLAVIGAVGYKIESRAEIGIASIGSGVVLGSLSFLYNRSLVHIESEVLVYEIPLFAILKDYPYAMLLLMAVILWAAIFTTAVTGTLGLAVRFQDNLQQPLWVTAFLLIALMLPLTSIGFSTLIEHLYPLYGILNLYVLISLLLYPIFLHLK